MASIHALANHLLQNRSNSGDDKGVHVSNSRVANPRDAIVARTNAQETYYIEDGWVFREHHGKYVECICRTEEIPAVAENDLPALQLP
jgi:hypothetical protein